MAAHHRADAAEQERSTDHAGCRSGRGAQERAAAGDRPLGRAIGLTIGWLTIGWLTIGWLTVGRLIVVLIVVSWGLRLLHHLAAVPYRAAGRRGGRRDIGHRTARLALS